MNWLRQLMARLTARPVIVVQRGEKMEERELLTALSGMTENHPHWKAVNQLLEEEIENLISQVSMPGLAVQPQAIVHTAGGLEWMRAFQYRLHEARKKAAEKLRALQEKESRREKGR